MITHTELVLDFALLRSFVVTGQLREGLCVVASATLENESSMNRMKLKETDQLLLGHALNGVESSHQAIGEVVKNLEVIKNFSLDCI